MPDRPLMSGPLAHPAAAIHAPGLRNVPPIDNDLRRMLEQFDGAPSEVPIFDDDALERRVRRRVREQVSARLRTSSSEDEREDLVRRVLDQVLLDEPTVAPLDRRRMYRLVVSDTLGFGPLDELMLDPTVSEIMCNGPETIYVERNGVLELTPYSFGDEGHLRSVISRIVRLTGRRVDESSPMVDARMPDGSRMNAILPPLALNGPVLTIRRFPEDRLTPETLVRSGTCSPGLMAALEACVRGRLNIVVSGGTSSGKTTILNVMSGYIGAGERVITIEDSAELTLHQPHVITLESRPANAEGEGRVSIRDLVRNALRMRPDRLVIGECRGGEALDVLQAMNTGHDGSLTTVHANSARDALRRLEMMVLTAGFDVPIWAVREQMASTLHLVLQMERLADGRRVVRSLSEIQSLEGDTIVMQDLFMFNDASGRVEATGLRPAFASTLAARGVDYPILLEGDRS